MFLFFKGKRKSSRATHQRPGDKCAERRADLRAQKRESKAQGQNKRNDYRERGQFGATSQTTLRADEFLQRKRTPTRKSPNACRSKT